MVQQHGRYLKRKEFGLSKHSMLFGNLSAFAKKVRAKHKAALKAGQNKPAIQNAKEQMKHGARGPFF